MFLHYNCKHKNFNFNAFSKWQTQNFFYLIEFAQCDWCQNMSTYYVFGKHELLLCCSSFFVYLQIDTTWITEYYCNYTKTTTLMPTVCSEMEIRSVWKWLGAILGVENKYRLEIAKQMLSHWEFCQFYTHVGKAWVFLLIS